MLNSKTAQAGLGFDVALETTKELTVNEAATIYAIQTLNVMVVSLVPGAVT